MVWKLEWFRGSYLGLLWGSGGRQDLYKVLYSLTSKDNADEWRN